MPVILRCPLPPGFSSSSSITLSTLKTEGRGKKGFVFALGNLILRQAVRDTYLQAPHGRKRQNDD
jgi:hypothetical protein